MALTEEQKEILSDALTPLYQNLEAEVIADVARRIKKTMTYTRTAELQAISMRNLGYAPSRIRSEAMKLLGADKDYQKAVLENTMQYKREVKELIAGIVKRAKVSGNAVVADAGRMSWADDMGTWESAGKALTESTALSQMVRTLAEATAGELANLTRSTGFKTMSGSCGVKDLYGRELDKALVKLTSGAFSSEQCVRDAVRDLAQSGIRTIDYASSRSYQLDTAVRMCLRTAVSQTAGIITDHNIENTGEALVQVSAHWGARNGGEGIQNHEQWQGKIYSIDNRGHPEEERRIGMTINDLKEATGYDVHGKKACMGGLHGINCRHDHYAFFEGVSVPLSYPPEPEPKEINGKKYDYYAMTQAQRRMERELRALKREKEALRALGHDTGDVQAKIRQKTAEYKLFSKSCGIKPKMNRAEVRSDTSDLTKTEAWKAYHTEVEKSINLGRFRRTEVDTKTLQAAGIPKEYAREIQKAVTGFSKEYDMRLKKVEVSSFTDQEHFESPVFYRADEVDGLYQPQIIVNQACGFWHDKEKYDYFVTGNRFAGSSVTEFMEHELAHVLTYQGCGTMKEVLELDSKLKGMYVPKISKYNDICGDGAETIAEAFVRKRSGRRIPWEAEELLTEYIEKWRK